MDASFVVISSSPPNSPLNRGAGKNGGHTQIQLHRHVPSSTPWPKTQQPQRSPCPPRSWHLPSPGPLHLAVLRDRGVAVELQLVVTVLRLAWLVVGVLVGVVVGQGHLAELLLRGVGHGARLEVLKRDGDEGSQLCCWILTDLEESSRVETSSNPM